MTLNPKVVISITTVLTWEKFTELPFVYLCNQINYMFENIVLDAIQLTAFTYAVFVCKLLAIDMGVTLLQRDSCLLNR